MKSASSGSKKKRGGLDVAAESHTEITICDDLHGNETASEVIL